MTAEGVVDPATSVEFSIEVAVPIERAFHVFTAEFDTWWPRDHHIGAVPMAVAILEPRAGGRWYEVGVDGSECSWGMVLAWDPPRHVAMSWHLDGEFRYDGDAHQASRVDVWFEAVGPARTEVRLVHTGLDRHGETWHRLRDAITRGWPIVLQLASDAALGLPPSVAWRAIPPRLEVGSAR